MRFSHRIFLSWLSKSDHKIPMCGIMVTGANCSENYLDGMAHSRIYLPEEVVTLGNCCDHVNEMEAHTGLEGTWFLKNVGLLVPDLPSNIFCHDHIEKKIFSNLYQ